MNRAHQIYAQDVSGCQRVMSDADQPSGRIAARAIEQAGEARARLLRLYEAQSLPLLHLPARTDDLAPARAMAEFLCEDARCVLFLGTGGSSLGGQAIAQLAGFGVPGIERTMRRELVFLDNLDAATLAAILESDLLRTAKVLAVSKSGGTPETLVQAACIIDALQRCGHDPASRVAVLTEPGDASANPLRGIARRYGLKVLDHDPGVGGRFSALSNVGMVPALVAGLDPQAMREGAHAVLEDLLAHETSAVCQGAAICHALERAGLMRVSVMMPYADRLRLFSAWYAQLWAESLGKGGQGSQPVAAAGPVDQHSQMQLFLDGPRDKLVNIVMPKTAGTGPRLPELVAEDAPLAYLAGRTVGDVTSSQQAAAADVLRQHGRPVRTFAVDKVDEPSLGALMMHFMLETILTGFMMNLDPFDQPAVEQGKTLTRDYLTQMQN